MFFFWFPANYPVDIHIALHGEEDQLPPLLDVSSFLYDVTLALEIARLGTDPEYRNFKFSHHALYRKGRPLAPRARPRVKSLSARSPLELEVVLWGAPLAIGAVWGLVQVIEKVSNWRLNRRMLEEQLKKIERENLEASQHTISPAAEQRVGIYSEDEYIAQLQERDALQLLEKVATRLAESRVKIEAVEVRLVRRPELSSGDEA